MPWRLIWNPSATSLWVTTNNACLPNRRSYLTDSNFPLHRRIVRSDKVHSHRANHKWPFDRPTKTSNRWWLPSRVLSKQPILELSNAHKMGVGLSPRKTRLDLRFHYIHHWNNAPVEFHRVHSDSSAWSQWRFLRNNRSHNIYTFSFLHLAEHFFNYLCSKCWWITLIDEWWDQWFEWFFELIRHFVSFLLSIVSCIRLAR